MSVVGSANSPAARMNIGFLVDPDPRADQGGAGRISPAGCIRGEPLHRNDLFGPTLQIAIRAAALKRH